MLYMRSCGQSSHEVPEEASCRLRLDVAAHHLLLRAHLRLGAVLPRKGFEVLLRRNPPLLRSAWRLKIWNPPEPHDISDLAWRANLNLPLRDVRGRRPLLELTVQKSRLSGCLCLSRSVNKSLDDQPEYGSRKHARP